MQAFPRQRCEHDDKVENSWCALLSLLVLEVVFVTAGMAIPPASAQAADAQAQIDSFVFAPQRLTPDASERCISTGSETRYPLR